VRACWPCLSRAGLALPVGEVIAPLAVRGRAFAGGGSCGLAIPPRRYGAFACLRLGRDFVGGCLRAALLLWWWVLFFALFLLLGLLIRALFCGLFTGVFGGRPPTHPTRLNRGGRGLRKEEGGKRKEMQAGQGFPAVWPDVDKFLPKRGYMERVTEPNQHAEHPR